MNAALFIPALMLGLASSLHCIGMCGPLSLAMPVMGLPPRQRYINLLLYQTGRISTYVLVGILVGLVGKSILLAGYQQLLSILAGLIVLVAAAGYYIGKRATPFSFLNGFYRAISQMVFRVIKNAGKPGGALLFGMANGLLPCGMVYIAAITSLSYGGVWEAGSFMFVFGAGTLPAMLAVSLAGKRFAGRHSWLQRVTPVVITAMGLLLVIRGLNLDIPYLSPTLSHTATDVLSCH